MTRRALYVSALFLLLAGGLNHAAGQPRGAAERTRLQRWIGMLYARRTAALVTGDVSALGPLYDRSRSGREALDHETSRVAHLHAWLDLHRARLLSARPHLRLVEFEKEGENRITVYVTLTTLLTYVYPDQRPGRDNLFGYTTYHVLTVAPRGERWVVEREWYEDPLWEQQQVGDGYPAGLRIASLPSAGPLSARRRSAAAYADRYSGVVVPGRADGRYNRRYPEFTFRGGDCSNFASQILTDPDAGGLARDWSWCVDSHGATVAWTRADAMVDHLLGTGRAVLLSRETLSGLVAGSALARLRPGDLIGYQKRDTVRHISVVTARDSRGWPLVNSHTADRYHVPCDLGWGAHVVYWLLQTALP
ncbi:MAG: amidase domain-containing protein [Bacteroidota bacterium]